MAKRKLVKLPKRIGGVKIPKAARKGPVVDFLNSSGGQVLLAEALVLTAGAFATRRLNADSTSDTPESMGARESIAAMSARVSRAFSEGIRAFRDALAEPEPQDAVQAINPDTPEAIATDTDLTNDGEIDEVRTKKKSRASVSSPDIPPAV